MTIDPIKLIITNQMVIINMLREGKLSSAALMVSAKALEHSDKALREMDELPEPPMEPPQEDGCKHIEFPK